MGLRHPVRRVNHWRLGDRHSYVTAVHCLVLILNIFLSCSWKTFHDGSTARLEQDSSLWDDWWVLGTLWRCFNKVWRVRKQLGPSDCKQACCLKHWCESLLQFRTFIRHFCPKQPTVIHTDGGGCHARFWPARPAGSDRFRSSLGFSILPKDTLTCTPGELNQWPSDNKTLALPLSHSHPQTKVRVRPESLMETTVRAAGRRWAVLSAC